jgi:hypothetical protein
MRAQEQNCQYVGLNFEVHCLQTGLEMGVYVDRYCLLSSRMLLFNKGAVYPLP